MSTKIAVVPTDDGFDLVISGVGEADAELVHSRLTSVVEVLEEVFASDTAVGALASSVAPNRLRACMALDLRLQALLGDAKTVAKAREAVAEGSELINDHGFPEFSDD